MNQHIACVEPDSGRVRFLTPHAIDCGASMGGTIVIARGDVNVMTRVRQSLACDNRRGRVDSTYRLPGIARGAPRAVILAAAADLVINMDGGGA